MCYDVNVIKGRSLGAHNTSDVRPLCPKTADEPHALVKTGSLLFTFVHIIYEALLEIYGGDNSHTVTEKRIRHPKAFSIQHVNEIDNPGCMRRYEIRSMLQKNFRYHALEVAKP